MEYPFTNQLLYIKRSVINVLLRNASCEPFKVPVNPELLGVPQYPKLIKSPMDFGTIKLKLDKRAYQTANECKSDFMDIFRNCYIFNEPGSLYVQMALKLENLFKRKMAELPMPEIYVPESALQTPKLNKVKKSKLSLNISTPMMVKHKPIGVTPISAIIKPDASHPRKRSRSHSGNGFKEEPSIKKAKGAIDLKICKNIIQSLMSKNYHDWNRFFLEPVDVEGLKLHDYYTIVKKPIDLSTIKTKLLEGRYQTNVEFSEDIKLIFKNCYLYNPEGHEVRRCGKLLEGIFMKLYQSSFPNHKHQVPKQPRLQTNYTEFQPLLQKILKRQNEIDVLNNDIVKRNQEIQESLNDIKNTEFIKTSNVNLNGNRKVPVSVTKKPSTKSFEPVKQETKPVLSHINDKNISPKIPVVSKQPVHREIKSDISELKLEQMNSSHKSTDHLDLLPQKSMKLENLHDSSVPNHRSTGKSIKDADQAKKLQNNDEKITNNVSIYQHSPNDLSRSTKNIQSKEIVQPDTPKTDKKYDEFNSNLAEIKEWIGSQSDSQREHIRELINKSEGRNVVQVNLVKLKPQTINRLFMMMKEMKKLVPMVPEVEVPAENLPDFTNEDRMQLSQDLSILGEKYSDKILSIYKKTESVESHDGECEIDFQKMKLVTLHRLREFASKYLQKRREKLKKGGNSQHPVGENGDDSDSDSSDSSDSDSNSDASSNSSSDADVFNTMPQVSKTVTPITTTPTVVTTSTSITTTTSNTDTIANRTAIVQSSPVTIQSSQSQPASSLKHVSSNSPLQSRLSDSSDSEPDSDADDDDDDDDGRQNNGVDSSTKRLRHTAPWNRVPSSTSVIGGGDVRSPAAFTPQSTKQKQSQVPYPMYNNNARSQLDESLRQIVQDAQAHENVKKQEEELRLNRMREEEEQKKQHLLKIQAMNESRKKLHTTEQMKKDQEMTRLKDRALADQKQRNLDIPLAVEREDYHQLLCDFEYNINHNNIMKIVQGEPHQVHL